MVNERTDSQGDASPRSNTLDTIWRDEKTANTYGARRNDAKDGSWTKYLGGSDNAAVEMFEGPKNIEFSNRLFEGFQKAVATGKPLVVEFTQQNCTHCYKLDKETMRSPEMKELADRAIWVKVDPAKDEDDKGNVGDLAQLLGIDRYPTTVVLDVKAESMRELGRLVGYFPGKQMADNMKQILPEVKSDKKDASDLYELKPAA